VSTRAWEVRCKNARAWSDTESVIGIPLFYLSVAIEALCNEFSSVKIKDDFENTTMDYFFPNCWMHA
jgi:hypothetical protein